MGSPTGETGRGGSENEHNVTLTKGFYLGKYEVTQAQYEAVMKGNGYGLSATPSQFGGNPNRPVEQVSWDDAQIFIALLNASEQNAGLLPSGWAYDLPTEAQWEYACRAGTNTTYWWGNTIASSNANYVDSGIGQTVEVGQYPANPWGFHDTHGNCWEWVLDSKGTYLGTSMTDPLVTGTGTWPIMRGGAFHNLATGLRSAARYDRHPATRLEKVSFRLVFKQITTPPSNLVSTAPLTIAENQPIGTVAGINHRFGCKCIFDLSLGERSRGHPQFPFRLERVDGALTTKVVFDYENNASSYSIRVQAKDEYNATVEGLFSVSLTDRAESVNGRNLAGFTNVADLLGLFSPAQVTAVWGITTGTGISIFIFLKTVNPQIVAIRRWVVLRLGQFWELIRMRVGIVPG